MGESKIEDFSERITPVNGAKIAVFWDVEDCPFPGGYNPDPDRIYHKIESAFRERDVRGKVSIWAYVDENNGSWRGEYLRNKTWKTRIYFLPGGASRRNRMLNDILLWEMDSPVDHPDPATLIVVSDKVRYDTKFFRILQNLDARDYGVFLVTPTEHVRPESSEWPGLLFDDVYCFGCESKSSELSLKKHKADAAEETPDGSEDQG